MRLSSPLLASRSPLADRRADQRAFGLLRWLAFLRRALARRLAVFFDMAARLLIPGSVQVGRGPPIRPSGSVTRRWPTRSPTGRASGPTARAQHSMGRGGGVGVGAGVGGAGGGRVGPHLVDDAERVEVNDLQVIEPAGSGPWLAARALGPTGHASSSAARTERPRCRVPDVVLTPKAPPELALDPSRKLPSPRAG